MKRKKQPRMTKRPRVWCEISVATPPESGEAVVRLLDRYGEGGAVIDSVPTPLGVSSMPEWGTVIKAYLLAGPREKKTLHLIQEGLRDLDGGNQILAVKIREVSESEWLESARKGLGPREIGNRLVIVPTWIKYAAKRDRVVLRIDPGMAFGSGIHPTTRLCLIALERYLRRGNHILDVGTGSGIQAIAAIKLGAARATALDLEAAAIEVALRNAQQNRVADRIRMIHGGLDHPASEIRPAHLIVINILAYTILGLLPELKAKLRPGGHLIGGGILAETSPEIQMGLRHAGWDVVEVSREDEWETFVARSPK